MSFLDKLKQQPPAKKPGILLYSKPGAGKTSIAAQFPKPVFLIDPKEDGIGDLQASGLAPKDIPRLVCNTWEQFHEYVDGLIDEAHDRETLVIDAFSTGGFEDLLFKYVADRHFEGDLTKEGFYSYGAGPQTAVSYMQAILAKLDRLRERMRIVVLSHSKIRTFNDPQRQPYDRIELLLDAKMSSALCGWATAIGFIDYVIFLDTDKNTKKSKGKGGTEREIHFTQSAVYDAKNRWGLTDPVPLGDSAREGYTNLENAIKAAFKNNKSVSSNEG